MNTIITTPDIKLFLAAVRDHLTDLSEEEREELVGGLDADMGDLVSERGVEALPDPADYAAELRAAAGFPEEMRRQKMPLHVLLRHQAVEVRSTWQHLLATRPAVAQAWDVVCAARPAWWVFRAWVAVQLLDLVSGPYEYLTVMPSLGSPQVGFLVLLAAVVLSVLLGMGKLWPGGATSGLFPRLLVAGLNVVAVLAVVAVFSRFPTAWDSHGLADGRLTEVYPAETEPGLVADGRPVRNVFAYDAQGKPLIGVQLFDQQGRPLTVSTNHRVRTDEGVGVVYPWLNGGRPLFNVFPLPVRTQSGTHRSPDVWTSSRPPALPAAPLAVVPPAALPTSSPTPAPDSGKLAGR